MDSQNINDMIPQGEAEKFVFLVDVAKPWTEGSGQRKSVINSHAAKRMHLKRRESQKQHAITERNLTNLQGPSEEDEAIDEQYHLQQLDQDASLCLQSKASLLDPLLATGGPMAVGSAIKCLPFCLLGSGQHDPFAVNPFIRSKDDHKLLHFCKFSHAPQ